MLAQGSKVGAWNTMPVSSRGSVTVRAADRNGAGGRGHETGDEAQQGRLAASGRPDQTDELVAPHIERDVGHGGNLFATARDEGLGHMVEDDHAIAAGASGNATSRSVTCPQ